MAVKFNGVPVKARGAAPWPDATKEITVTFEEPFHFTSAMKNGGNTDDVILLV